MDEGLGADCVTAGTTLRWSCVSGCMENNDRVEKTMSFGINRISYEIFI